MYLNIYVHIRSICLVRSINGRGSFAQVPHKKMAPFANTTYNLPANPRYPTHSRATIVLGKTEKLRTRRYWGTGCSGCLFFASHSFHAIATSSC